MDSNNWRPSEADIQSNQQQQQPPMDMSGGGGGGGDWRSQLPIESRQRIVNKILETLKCYLPFSGQKGYLELKKIALIFEEKIYTAATSQPDYLRKISMKMLSIETKSQNQNANLMPSNSVGNGRIPQDPACVQPNQQQQQQQPSMDMSGGVGDWRSQLQIESRQRIVNKILETLERHLPFSGQDGYTYLKEIAVRFEEKIYSVATSQPDYLRKISMKMLSVELGSQSQNANSMSSNSVGNGRTPRDPGIN